MSDPFIGEIRLFSFLIAPQGWAFCQGQLMPINQNQALFSLLGTTYGGNGQTNFALPDLRGRAPVHWGTSAAQGTVNLGQAGGEMTHTLVQTEMPQHTHTVSAVPTASTGAPAGAYWAPTTQPAYGSATAPQVAMSSAAAAAAGGSQPHDNMPPYLVLNFAIAIVGIFPSH